MRTVRTIIAVLIGHYVGGFIGLLSLFALSHVFTIGGGLDTTFHWALTGVILGAFAGGFVHWHLSRPLLTLEPQQKIIPRVLEVEERGQKS